MEAFRRDIRSICDYSMSEETMDRFLDSMVEIPLRSKKPLISYGVLDDNVYVMKEGIVRIAYFDGLNERTLAFSTPGNMIISYHSFYMKTPSLFQYESCVDSIVMKVTKAKFDELISQSEDFKNWVLRMSLEQLYCWEMKTSVINGTARERFEALIKTRPEILKKVSGKIIASYIGVNQPYLSRLKRQVLLGG